VQVALRRTIGPFQLFALAIGVIIGSGWVVLIGDLIKVGGPAGTIAGFAIGGFTMMLVAAAYGELSSKIPLAGGEFIFAHTIFGPAAGFAVGWFIALYLIGSTAFEAISLAAILQTLMPEIRGPTLYVLLGYPVTMGAVSIGIAGVALITFLNHRDVRLVVRFQSIVTYGFLAIAFGVVILGISLGRVANLHPLFVEDSGKAPWVSALWIVATSAYFLTGFQAIPQAIEERAVGVSSKTVLWLMVSSVATAALFLCLVVLAVGMAAPWKQTSVEPMMTAVALSKLGPGPILATVVLIAAAASLLKTWNALALMASRLLMAQARERFLPAWLAAVHPIHKTPATASLLVGGLTLGGIMLGRGALVPIVNMASGCLAGTFVLILLAVIKLRRVGSHDSAGAVMPGGVLTLTIAFVGASLMAIFAIIGPLFSSTNAIPLEWTLLVGWACVGALIYCIRGRVLRHRREAER
jgi:basic amino acid/polyamine antiporter, APA family